MSDSLGRQGAYSEKLAEMICHRVRHGEPLKEICDQTDFIPSHSTVRSWLNKNKSTFKIQFHNLYQDAVKKRDADIESGEMQGRTQNITYSDQLADHICERISDGETLTSICKKNSMPKYGTVRKWLLPTHPMYKEQFAENFKIAMAIKADWCFDQIEDLAQNVGDSKEEIAKARFQVDAYKIAASRNDPQRYEYRGAVHFGQPEKENDGNEGTREDALRELSKMMEDPEGSDALAVLAEKWEQQQSFSG